MLNTRLELIENTRIKLNQLPTIAIHTVHVANLFALFLNEAHITNETSCRGLQSVVNKQYNKFIYSFVPHTNAPKVLN